MCGTIAVSFQLARRHVSAIGDQLAETLREGGNEMETGLRTKSGEVREVVVNSRVIEIDGREVLHVVLRDITDRRQAELALHESQKRLDEELKNFAELDGQYKTELEKWEGQKPKIAKRIGNPPQLWKTYVALGDLRQAQRKGEETQRAYSDAFSVIKEVAAGLRDESLREIFLNSDHVQGIRKLAGKEGVNQ